jgi:predicted nucleotidyltransferase
MYNQVQRSARAARGSGRCLLSREDRTRNPKSPGRACVEKTSLSLDDGYGAMSDARAKTNSPHLEDILGNLRTHMNELREQYGVRSLSVFGSYLRGGHHRRSDLDLLVEFEVGTRMTLFRFVRLEAHLRRLLGVKVDLVMKSALKPAIGERILAEALPV